MPIIRKAHWPKSLLRCLISWNPQNHTTRNCTHFITEEAKTQKRSLSWPRFYSRCCVLRKLHLCKGHLGRPEQNVWWGCSEIYRPVAGKWFHLEPRRECSVEEVVPRWSCLRSKMEPTGDALRIQNHVSAQVIQTHGREWVVGAKLILGT